VGGLDWTSKQDRINNSKSLYVVPHQRSSRSCARVLIYECVYGVGGRCTFGLDLPLIFFSPLCDAAVLWVVHRVF